MFLLLQSIKVLSRKLKFPSRPYRQVHMIDCTYKLLLYGHILNKLGSHKQDSLEEISRILHFKFHSKYITKDKTLFLKIVLKKCHALLITVKQFSSQSSLYEIKICAFIFNQYMGLLQLKQRELPEKHRRRQENKLNK